MTTQFSDAALGLNAPSLQVKLMSDRIVEIEKLPPGQEKAANILSILDHMMTKRLDWYHLWTQLPPEANQAAKVLRTALMTDSEPLVEMGKDEEGKYHYPASRTSLAETKDFDTASHGWIRALSNVSSFALTGAYEHNLK
jgi:hypothetical protein